MKRIKKYISRLFKILNKQELRVLPGEIAYSIVLSLIPLVTLVGLIASRFSISMESVTTSLSKALPMQIVDIILPAFNSPSFGVGISMVIGFIVASNGTSSIIVASNMLFKIEDGNYLKRRIKALFMLIVLIALFFFVIVVMAFGNNLFSFLYDLIFDNEMPKILYNIFLVIKWSIGIIVIYIMIKLVFAMAPEEDIPSKCMNKGALFTTLLWVIATVLYSAYITNFANYNLFYSSLASIVILMIWVYILSYTLVIGIAINSNSYLAELKEKN